MSDGRLDATPARGGRRRCWRGRLTTARWWPRVWRRRWPSWPSRWRAATHAPGLTYLACVGSLDPELPELYPSSEDLRYLDGRSAEVTIPDLFDHARRGRVDTVFFGAAEVDSAGRTNMTAAGQPGAAPRKFPGVAGAATLRQWVQAARAAGAAAVAPQPRARRCRWPPRATRSRPVRLISDLGTFELGRRTARRLLARHPWATLDAHRRAHRLRVLGAGRPARHRPPDARTLAAIRALDPRNLRDALVGGSNRHR